MMRFSQPMWFLALILLPVIWLQAKAAARAVPLQRRWGAIVLRIAVTALLIFALAGPEWRAQRPGVDLLLLVDASESIGKVDEAWLERQAELLSSLLGPADRLGILAFGRDTVIVQGFEDSAPLLSVLPDGTASDLERALRVAASLSPPDRLARILLVTDGRQTSGDAVEAAAALYAAGTSIHVWPADQPIVSEVLVEALLAPQRIAEGEPFSAQAVIQSTDSTEARVYLFRNGLLLDERTVHLQPGRNVVAYPDLRQDERTARYELRVDAPLDTWVQNNVGHVVVSTELPDAILLLTSDPDESALLERALLSQHLAVEIQEAGRAAIDASVLTAYSAVILHNVPAHHLSAQALADLEYYVSRAGGGLVLIGGDQSFGLGGYENTLLERLAPVQVRAPEHVLQANVAMVLVIDKSGSMNEQVGPDQPTKLALAKEAVLGTAQSLDSRDFLGVVAFDTRAFWAAPLGPLVDREWFAAQVLRLVADGGTNAYAGLELAYTALAQLPAGVKHVILLSDGQTSAGPFATLVDAMRAAGITLSTVAVGEADTALMQRLAVQGRGRYYYTDDPSNIPFIFATETRRIAPLPFEEQRVQPILLSPGEFLLGFPQDLPPLDGYLITHPKRNATVHIETGDGTPLLASWRYGLGRVVAYTGSLAPAWASEWLAWDGFPRLWAQALRWSQRPLNEGPLRAEMEIRDGLLRIWVDAVDDDGSYINFLDLNADIIAADGTTLTLPLEQSAPGRYEAATPASAVGIWTATIRGPEDQVPVPLIASAVSSYPEEYRHLGTDMRLLTAIAETGGGRVLTEIEQVGAVLREPASSSGFRQLWPLFTLAALFLFMFDLGIRYVPSGTIGYTWYQLRKRRGTVLTRLARIFDQNHWSTRIRTMRSQERTPPRLDSRQAASQEAHRILARRKKERQATRDDPARPADS